MKKITIMAILFASIVSAAQAKIPDKETINLLRSIMYSRVAIQRIVKDYIYIGNGIAITKAKREMSVSMKEFQSKKKILEQSINDTTALSLQRFIDMSFGEVKEILKSPYTKDNAAIIIDLAETIAEGELKLAEEVRNKSGYKGPVFKGERYDITQIAKYYIAYHAGLKDKVTIDKMKSTVKHFQSLIKEMKTNKGNTPKMNQIVSRGAKLWDIVYPLYLDIDGGGLPLIVYSTTNKMDEEMLEYRRAAAQQKKSIQ